MVIGVVSGIAGCVAMGLHLRTIVVSGLGHFFIYTLGLCLWSEYLLSVPLVSVCPWTPSKVWVCHWTWLLDSFLLLPLLDLLVPFDLAVGLVLPLVCVNGL